MPPSEIEQHLAWLRQYAELMNERNWRDMKLRIERQLSELERALGFAR